MKLAVPFENGAVFGHFGHTERFKLYSVANGEITDARLVSTGGTGHSALAQFLSGQGVDVLICGGIGGGAKQALAAAGIQVLPGVSGEADRAVVAFLAGELRFDPNAQCDHHSEGEHGCGEHGCGEGDHSCAEHGCGGC